MGLTEKNEARRFITFIDAAYENKVKIICSAETDPDRLFVISNQSMDDSADTFMHKEMIGDLLDAMNQTREPTASEMMKLAIFTAEDEKFAFKRAVSRIKEMQSREYLSLPHSPVALDQSGLQHVNTSQMAQGQPLGTGGTTAKVNDLPPSVHTDDFGDEASYTGYVKLYQQFNTDKSGRDTIMDTFRHKEDSKPKFKENHFWAVGDKWGSKTGKWGEGIKALFGQSESDSKKKK